MQGGGPWEEGQAWEAGEGGSRVGAIDFSSRELSGLESAPVDGPGAMRSEPYTA